MNADLITELKGKYRNFLHTPKGRLLLNQALQTKKEWKTIVENSEACLYTSGVNPNYFHTELKDKITKLTIIPIGLNNLCHLTSRFLCDETLGITSRIGYNITACPCGCFINYEIHSVNKYNGQLYDFTRDFNDETEKYFLELDTNMSADVFISIFGKAPITINKGCRCGIDWKDLNLFLKPEDKFINRIKNIEKALVI